MEAWLLGDASALKNAYPKSNVNILETYSQDSICGIWEILANLIQQDGANDFKEERLAGCRIRKIEMGGEYKAFYDH